MVDYCPNDDTVLRQPAPPNEAAEVEQMLFTGLKLADRRDALCRGMRSCPACEEMQVQLVDHIAVPAKWKCRHCGHRFEHEAVALAAPLSPQDIAEMRKKHLHFHGFATQDVLHLLDAIEALTVENTELRHDIERTLAAASAEAAEVERLTAENATLTEKAAYWRGQHSALAQEVLKLMDRNAALTAQVARLEDVIPAALSIADPDHGWYSTHRHRVESGHAIRSVTVDDVLPGIRQEIAKQPDFIVIGDLPKREA